MKLRQTRAGSFIVRSLERIASTGYADGFRFFAVVKCLLFMACSIPSLEAQIAGEMQFPQANASDSPEIREARNVFYVAQAAKAAGYSGKWSNVDEMIDDLERGIDVKLEGQSVDFKIVPLTTNGRKAALKHIRIEGGQEIVWRD